MPTIEMEVEELDATTLLSEVGTAGLWPTDAPVVEELQWVFDAPPASGGGPSIGVISL